MSFGYSECKNNKHGPRVVHLNGRRLFDAFFNLTDSRHSRQNLKIPDRSLL